MNASATQMIKTAFEIKLAHWGGFGVITLLLFLALLPVQIRQSALQKEVDQITAKVLEAEDVAKRPLEFEAMIQEKKKALEKLDAYTLNKGEQRKVISLITNIAQAARISISEIKPLEDEKGPDGAEMPPKAIKPVFFRIEEEAPFNMVDFFFKQLRESQLMIRVNDFDITPIASREDWVSLAMTITAYEYVPKGIMS